VLPLERELAGSDLHDESDAPLQGTHNNPVENVIRPIAIGKNYVQPKIMLGSLSLGCSNPLSISLKVLVNQVMGFEPDALVSVSSRYA